MVLRKEILAYYVGNKEEIKKAVERYRTLKTIIEQSKDDTLQDMLRDVVNAARRYVEAVIRMEYKAREVKQVYGDDPIAWKLEIEPADEARRVAHDALIAYLEAFNRNAAKKYGWEPEGKIPVGGLYSRDPDDLTHPASARSRNRIADWAFYLVIGLGESEVF